MTRLTKVLLLTLIVGANFAVLWWRYRSQEIEVVGVGPTVAELGKAQVDLVIDWRNAASVPLSPVDIRQFVESINWDSCATIPAKAESVAIDELTAAERESLQNAFVELLEIYADSDPNRLFDYMTSCGKGISPSMTATLRNLLSDGDVKLEESLANRTSREIFLMIADRIRFDSCWESLVSGSGCVSLWRVGTSQTAKSTEGALGSSMIGLFRNQTRFHQVFDVADGGASPDIRATGQVFADIQFVATHDSSLQSEPSPYFIRLVLDRKSGKWKPVEMIHVATISGNSPMLLF